MILPIPIFMIMVDVIVDILVTLAFRTIFVVLAAVFGFAVSAVILLMGIILKCVSKKIGRGNLNNYSSVLIVLGGIYTVFGIFYAVYAFGSFKTINITPEYLSEGMFLIQGGTVVICSAFVLIPAMVGVLLELIYRNIQKLPPRIIAVILFVLAAFALIISIFLIILAAYGVKTAYGV